VWSLSQGAYSLVGGRGAAMALLLGGGAGLFALRANDPEQRRVRLIAKCLTILGVGTLLVAWVYSKTTPAWAPRYLAVIVGPLLLLFGLGLARAGRLGVVALVFAVCFWVLDPIPTSTSAKSNVAAALAKVRPHLRDSMLVLSTQPEQVPTVEYYLHRPARYVTPLGPVPDPRVFDWRNALNRFRRSSVKTELLPALRSLRPGQRVLLVTPVNFPKQPKWMAMINRASRRWTATLAGDPALRQVASSQIHWQAIGSAVRVTVYAPRSAASTGALPNS
jgi:hypothetical protein